MVELAVRGQAGADFARERRERWPTLIDRNPVQGKVDSDRDRCTICVHDLSRNFLSDDQDLRRCRYEEVSEGGPEAAVEQPGSS